MKKTIQKLVFFITIFVPVILFANEDDTTEIKKIDPVLSVNIEPAVCHKLLNLVHDAYQSKDSNPKILDPKIPRRYRNMHRIYRPDTDEEWNGFKRLKFERIRYRINGRGGEKYVLEPIASEISTEGNKKIFLVKKITGLYGKEPLAYSFMIFENGAFPLAGDNDRSVEDNQIPLLDSENIKQSKSIISFTNTIPVESEGELYLVWSDEKGRDLIQPLMASKISPSMEIGFNERIWNYKVCETEFLGYEGSDNPNRFIYQHYHSELEDLRKVLSIGARMAGNDMPSEYGDVVQRLWTKILRPWTLDAEKNEPTVRIDDLFDGWKHYGPWEYRQYRNLLKAMDRTILQLAGMYKKQMHWTDDKSYIIAANTVNEFHNSLVGDNYSQHLFKGRTGVASERSDASKFRRLLLSGDEGANQEITDYLNSDVDLDLEKKIVMTEHHYIYSFPEYEQAIFYTLESNSNDGLRLLIEYGVDINARNWFGKTPLMFAAHLNNKKAVEELLKSGAEINVKTGDYILPRYGRYDDPKYFQVGIRDRTALMYAAENASFELLKTLIDAGADINAIDSRGRKMLDYLSLNKVMSENELEQAKVILNTSI